MIGSMIVLTFISHLVLACLWEKWFLMYTVRYVFKNWTCFILWPSVMCQSSEKKMTTGIFYFSVSVILSKSDSWWREIFFVLGWFSRFIIQSILAKYPEKCGGQGSVKWLEERNERRKFTIFLKRCYSNSEEFETCHNSLKTIPLSKC